MATDYISNVTEETLIHVFSRMTDSEFSAELFAMRESIDLYMSSNVDICGSFVLEFISNVYDIAKDSLVCRFIDSHVPLDLDGAEIKGAIGQVISFSASGKRESRE